MVGIALAGWMVACAGANAETLKLSAAANAQAAAKSVMRYAEQRKFANAKVYDKQVFQVSLGGEVLGTLVSGSGLFTTEVQSDNSTCFIALVKPDNKVVLMPTVGFGDWETESCLSIEAVGTLSPQPQTGFGRIVVIHGGSTGPASSGRSPVVLMWNSKTRSFEIDLEASMKAGRVSEGTVAAMRKALQ
jgi:hypothetical protein